jgi:tetrahydromethanopterin S-methyltransferase subunit G
MKNTRPSVIVEIGMIKKQRKRREHIKRKSNNLPAHVFQNSCKSKVLLGTKETL